MKAGRARELRPNDLVAYLEGEVTPSDAASIEAALGDAPGAARKLKELRGLRDALSAPVDELERVDLVPKLRPVLAQPSPAPRKSSRIPWWPTALAAAAASILLLRGSGMLREPSEEFRAKSAAATDHVQGQWAAIQVYRVQEDGKREHLGDRMRASDGLLFSYTNLGPEPFAHLMVFALDARGEVRWFYPAYDDPGANPESIVLDKTVAQKELPDLIHHDFPPGPLTVYALFTSLPLHVSDIESLVHEHGGGSPLFFPSTSQKVLTTRVEP